ncbi:SCP-like protein [Teladorsagia circumcincta]|uniref:SCP-like protein n=1 Tax=Teladorsagia circumcincta TaxID=45464 RepID=A0A2G9UIM6_TELCI|nr:SCP-like protein [Teladorsagia circumcincta]
MTVLTCSELRNGQLIYRAGTPCQSDEDCTTYPRSTCNATETLCHVQPFDAVPKGENEQCSGNTGMTDRLREKFLMMHNYRRSRMALGKVKNFKGESFPKAANMEKMVYNCDLEADAMIYAETCALGRSYPGTRKGQGENVAVVEPRNATSFEEAAQFILWSTTNKVGCAIGKCGGSYFVVCRYSPRAAVLFPKIPSLKAFIKCLLISGLRADKNM